MRSCILKSYSGKQFHEKGFFIPVGWHGRVSMFFLIGALSTLIDVILLWFFTERVGIWYLAFTACSYCCRIVVSYSLNKALTFHDTGENIFVQFSSFVSISLICLFLTLIVIWCAVTYFQFTYLSAKSLLRAEFFS